VFADSFAIFGFSFANVLTTVPNVSTIHDMFVIIVLAESSGDRLDIAVLCSTWFVVVVCCCCTTGDAGHCCGDPVFVLFVCFSFLTMLLGTVGSCGVACCLFMHHRWCTSVI
jgi:hypothetical protein